MGKAGKWFKSFLTGKKEKHLNNNNNNTSNNNGSINQSTSTTSQNPTQPVTVVVPRPSTPKEKKRWSFRRSSPDTYEPPKVQPIVPAATQHEQKPVQDLPVQEFAADTTVAPTLVVDEAVDVVLPLCKSNDQEVAAVIKIQSVFRSYLARKALKALRGLVKLQALVRGHLVRKQATATLRCMQALVIAQTRARAQRIRSVDEGSVINHRNSTHRRNSQEKIKHAVYDMEENIKIVEMDRGEFKSNINNRNSYSSPTQQRTNDRMDNQMSTKLDHPQYSPAPSAITDMSPRTCNSHFEDYSFQNSPLCYSAVSRPDPSRTPFSFPRPEYAETMSYDYPLYPNYMANTESSRAKVRSQSAPKQRPPEFERQPSRGRRPSVEGRNIPRGAKMQRSSSHVGSTAQNYQYPWSVKLDKSTISLKDSECGSTCSMATNAYYARSVVSYDPRC